MRSRSSSTARRRCCRLRRYVFDRHTHPRTNRRKQLDFLLVQRPRVAVGDNQHADHPPATWQRETGDLAETTFQDRRFKPIPRRTRQVEQFRLAGFGHLANHALADVELFARPQRA